MPVTDGARPETYWWSTAHARPACITLATVPSSYCFSPPSMTTTPA
jgi:hypothetical protein